MITGVVVYLFVIHLVKLFLMLAVLFLFIRGMLKTRSNNKNLAGES
jgi:VIT1/CCC1 family predicted Fe2+/Mn2+ transporter